MSLLGNIIWFLFGGAVMGLSWVAAGVLWALTIVGIPVGKQCFKFATLCFFPFGKHVIASNNTTGNFLLNLLWVCFTGLPLAMVASLIGALYYITIIGIPFGKQYFKLARLALTPFGAVIM